jgi:hypothetical protein
MKDSQLYILTSNIAIIMAIASPWLISSIFLLGLALISFVIGIGHFYLEKQIERYERIKEKVKLHLLFEILESQNKRGKRNDW